MEKNILIITALTITTLTTLITEARSAAYLDTTPVWEDRVPVTGSEEWTKHLHKELDHLGKDLLDVIPADSATYCPNYKNLPYNSRKEYWVFMISAMAYFESGFKTATKYQEGFRTRAGNRVVSRGLLQISIESSKSYQCGITKEEELHDPFKNLSCGVRILNKWVATDGRIAGKTGGQWRGAARYWAVMRSLPGKKSHRTIQQGSRMLAICQ